MTVQSRMLSSSFLANSMQSPFSNVSFNHNHHSGVFIRSSLADTGNEHPSTIWNVGEDKLWYMKRKGGTRPGWTEEKVLRYLNHSYN